MPLNDDKKHNEGICNRNDLQGEQKNDCPCTYS